MKQIEWKDYWMLMAETTGLRSDCCRVAVAAVIVKDNVMVSTGYNGTPAGVTDCNDGGCERCNDPDVESGVGYHKCRCSHAEENAIVLAAREGRATAGATMYVTLCPCLPCARMIINSGIKHVLYKSEHVFDEDSMQLLLEAEVMLEKYEPTKKEEK